MTDTVTLRYDGPSPRVRVPAYDIDVRPGEEIEVDADTMVPIATDDDEEETQPLPAFLTERLDFVRVRDYTAILSESVAGLEAALESGEYDAHLDALAHAEREGKNRTTALDAIHDRRTEAHDNED